MSNVEQLDEYRPHIALKGQRCAHVVPVALIENLVSGKVSIDDADPELIRDILADWLTQVQDNE